MKHARSPTHKPAHAHGEFVATTSFRDTGPATDRLGGSWARGREMGASS